MGFRGGSDDKQTAASNAGDPDSIPVSGRYPGEGNGYLPQYSYLENSMDRGVWWNPCRLQSWTVVQLTHCNTLH